MANDHEELVALFRYSVISEAVARRLSSTERGLVVRALASRSWASPEGEEHCYSRSTLDRWIAAYHRDGLAGLSPVGRADKGRGRVSPELMAEAVRLRRAVRRALQLRSPTSSPAPMACFSPNAPSELTSPARA